MQTNTLLAALLKENVRGGVADAAFRRTDLLNLLGTSGRVMDNMGSEPIEWPIATAANGSVESFSEGQAPPVSGAQTYKRPSLNVLVNARGVFGITGHARDNAAKGGFVVEVPTIEEALTKSDVLKKAEDLLLGSTTDVGIAAIIDSTGTYAGLSQASVSQWASEENGSVGALTLAALQSLLEEMVSPSGGSSVPRGAKPTHWLMPTNQYFNYLDLAGAPGAANAAFRWRAGDPADFSYANASLTGSAYMGVPIAVISGITSTEIYLVDIMGMKLWIHRDLTIEQIASNPENLQYQVSTRMALEVTLRNHHGKMTGITA